MNRFALLFISFFFLAFLTPEVFSENIRGNLEAELSLTGQKSATMPIDSLMSINASDAGEYLEAVEIEIQIPQQIRQYRDSFALYLYKNVSPRPSVDNRAYIGRRLLFHVLPSTSKLYVQIPVSGAFKPSDVPGTLVIPDIQNISSFPMILSVLPVMKGIPNSLYSTMFTVTVKAVYSKMAKIQISIRNKDDGSQPDPELITLFIDDRQVDFPKDYYELPVGIHTIRVESKAFEDADINLGLEEGQNKKVSIDLIPRTPYLYIEGPKEAEVFLDGKKTSYVAGKKIASTPGEHVIIFKIGDYSISKKFQITPGKTYKISLFFDVLVQEN